MFAMGVLNTQAGGQPVFWELFIIMVLIFTFNRFRRKQQEGFDLPKDALSWLLALAGLAGFISGIIRSHQYAFPAIAFVVGLVPIVAMIKILQKRQLELLKWTILCRMHPAGNLCIYALMQS